MLWPLLEPVRLSMFWPFLEPMCVPTDEAHCQVLWYWLLGKSQKISPATIAGTNLELLHLHQTLSLYPSHTRFLRIVIVWIWKSPTLPLLHSPLRAYKNWELFSLEVDSSTPAWDMSCPQSSGFPKIKPNVVCIKIGLSWALGCLLLSRGLNEGLLSESWIWFLRILSIFALIFIRETGLKFSFFVGSLCCLGIRVILA